jgi:hypothetical protein
MAVRRATHRHAPILQIGVTTRRKIEAPPFQRWAVFVQLDGMSDAPVITPPSEALRGPASAATSVVARHCHILSALAEAGLDIALDLKAQIHALTPPPPEPDAPPLHPLDLPITVSTARASADLGLAFARVSRAVRLSIALHERLMQGEAVPRREPRTARPDRSAIHGHQADDTETSALAAREPLFERDLADVLPEHLIEGQVDDLIAQICADLGLDANRVVDLLVARKTVNAPLPDGGAAPRWAPQSPAADAQRPQHRPSG